MRPSSPRESLLDQTPQERAYEKAQIACAWLAVFGHSTERILRHVLGVQARGICARLQRAGLMRRVKVPLSAVAVWALTAHGLRIGEFALQRRVKYLSHPERMTISRLIHDLAVQEEACNRLPTDLPGLRRLRADRELRSIPTAARPDLLIRHIGPDGLETIVCLEIEISSKGSAELRSKMEAMLPLMKPRMLWVWTVTEGKATVERYERTWAEVVETHGTGYELTPAQLLQACRFRLPEKPRWAWT